MTPRFSTAALLVVFAAGVSGTVTLAQDGTPSRPGTAPAHNHDESVADVLATDAVEAAEDTDDEGLFADPEPGEAEGEPDDPADAPRVEAEDLPMGEAVEVEGNQAVFRFHADAPGMLTLLTYVPGGGAQARMQLEDAEGNSVPGGFINGNAAPGNFGARIVVDEWGNPAGALPGLSYLTVPLTEAGDYRIELNVVGDTEDTIKIGGSWVAFEQVAGVPVQPVAPVQPPPPPPPPFDPTEVATELGVGESIQLETEDNVGWVKLVADEPGTLVLVTNAEGMDVSLSAFADGQFADAQHSANRNRGGQRGREALMFHANAGDAWYIRVYANGDAPVPVRAALVPDDLEPAEDE